MNDTRVKLVFENFTPSLINIYVGKADYVHPYSKNSKLEIGIKSSIVNTDNQLIYNNRSEDGTFTNDLLKSDHFRYKENVNAAYASFSTTFHTFSLQAGLRTELTNSEGNSIAQANVVSRNYVNLFPALYLRNNFRNVKQSDGLTAKELIVRIMVH